MDSLDDSLAKLGWSPFFSDQLATRMIDGACPFRVATQQRDRFALLGGQEPLWGQARGRLYQGGELPAVGDWVLAVDGDEGDAIIECVLERKTSLVRAAAGRRTEDQCIAANLDVVFVVTSANADLNPRRLERYLAVVTQGGAAPVIVINKADLAQDRGQLLASLGEVAHAAPVVLTAALDGDVDGLRDHLSSTTTAAFVGSSGVGKSTLVNALFGAEIQATAAIRADDGKGRHTTRARELFVVPGVGILIDTPGIRELGLASGPADAESGLATAFAEIDELAAACKFRDCRHEREPGCRVQAAAEAGTLAPERLAAFRALTAELEARAAREGEAWRAGEHRKKLSKQIKQIKKLKGG